MNVTGFQINQLIFNNDNVVVNNDLNPVQRTSKSVYDQKTMDQLQQEVNKFANAVILPWDKISKSLGMSTIECRKLWNKINQKNDQETKVSGTGQQVLFNLDSRNPTNKQDLVKEKKTDWTLQEEDKLRQAVNNCVKEFGSNSWFVIGKEMGLAPTICQTKWKKMSSEKEVSRKKKEAKIKKSVEEINRIKVGDDIKGKKTSSENDESRKGTQEGTKNSVEDVNRIILGSKRAKNHEWTEEETNRLLELVQQYGNNWTVISEAMGLTYGVCQGRWKALQNGAPKDGKRQYKKWTHTDIEKLKKGIEKYGSENKANIENIIKEFFPNDQSITVSKIRGQIFTWNRDKIKGEKRRSNHTPEEDSISKKPFILPNDKRQLPSFTTLLNSVEERMDQS